MASKAALGKAWRRPGGSKERTVMIPAAVVATTAAALAATVVIHGQVPPGLPTVHPSQAPLHVGHTASVEQRFINMQTMMNWFVGIEATMQRNGLQNDRALRWFMPDLRPTSPEELAAKTVAEVMQQPYRCIEESRAQRISGRRRECATGEEQVRRLAGDPMVAPEEARRSDRDMCENRRAEQSATTKSVRNTSFQLYRFNTSTPLLRC